MDLKTNSILEQTLKQCLKGVHYKCSICQKNFKQKSHLDSHLRTHSSQKAHSCKICQKHFSRKGYYKKHMIMHSDQKLQQCPNCEERFPGKEFLKKHIQSNHKHVCSKCSATFSCKSYLKSHMISHSRDKPFMCPSCRKAFNRKAHLVQHNQRVHNNFQPYICYICLKQFAKKRELKSHAEYHSIARPFICDLCSKAFTRKESIVNHLKVVHNDGNPFSCSKCYQTFRNKRNLNAHSERHSMLYELLSNKEHNKAKDSSQNEMTSEGYFATVKEEINDSLEPRKPEFCFEVPIVKQESNADKQSPSCSYQSIPIKEEVLDRAGPTCVNLFEDSFVKQETEIS